MLKKICKQREKIERLAAKENDAEEKLTQLRQELAAEKDALDEMEKEHLFALMRERKLSLEETIALMEKSAEVLPEDIEEDMPDDTEPEEPEKHPADETEAATESIFTEDTAELFEEEPEASALDGDSADNEADDAESIGSFFKGFRSKAEENDNGFWQ